MNGEQNQYPDGIVLIRIIYKYIRQIFIFVAVSITAAVIFSSPYFIPKYYKSEIIFYPPSTNSNKILIEKDPRFGSDKEIDEHTQIIKSSIVRDSIINKYNLVSHFKIDTTKQNWPALLYKKLDNNIKINRTPYNSISVNVYDTDPVIAAQIANDLVRISDQVKSSIIKENLKLAFISISREFTEKSFEVDNIIQSLNDFMETPISLRVTQKDKTDTEKLKEQLDIQSAIEKARKGGRLKEIETLFNYQLKLQQLNEIQYSYFQAYVSLNSSMPSCYIITPAEVSYTKVGPKRTIIVIVTFFSSLFSGMCLVVFIEKFKKFRQLIINP